MPRDGSNIYSQPFPDVVEDTTIESTVYNGFTNDVAADLNTPRPIVAGGTGATSASDARFNLAAEAAAQLVTNYDSHLWVPGSFRSAASATGAPNTNAFSGVCYIGEALASPPTNQNVVLEARDATDGKLWIRRKTAGVWNAWALDNDLSGINTAIAALDTEKVDKIGDTMTGPLTLTGSSSVITATAKPHTFGSSAGTAGAVVASSDANILLYAAGTNWAGIGADGLGQMWFRTGLSGSVAPGVWIDTNQVMHFTNPPTGVLKKNYVVNGAMQVSQENGVAAGTTSGYYPVDGFSMLFVNAGVQSAVQQPGVTPGGSSVRLRISCATADASVAAGDFLQVRTSLEGFRIADLKSGAASAKTVTLQFGVKAPAGTYCVSFFNNPSARFYVAEYVIAAGEANTDVVKSITLTLDTAGTWLSDSGIGMDIRFTLMAGATYQTATPSTWVGGSLILATASQFNLMGTSSNIFELFDVSLTEGSVAPPFQVPDYPSELALCQRYYAKFTAEPAGMAATATVTGSAFRYPVPMRIAPTIACTGYSTNAGSAGTYAAATPAPTTTAFNYYNSASNWTISAHIGFLVLTLNARL